jgi:D-alanyl-D-alanine endopeptidase (penicillin-binding protein 7)
MVLRVSQAVHPRRWAGAGILVLVACLSAAAPGLAQTRFGLSFARTESGLLVPELRAAAAIVYDPQNGEVLWENRANDQRSIASLTKMMTALVFLETGPDLSEEVVIHTSDVRRAFTTRLLSGYRMTVGDLLHLMLIASDNAAARALARVSVYGSEGFIEKMNLKARNLGLDSTTYVDPSGLRAENVSSAYDMVRLLAHVSLNEPIAAIMQMSDYTAHAGRRRINVRSTNQLVRGGDFDVVAGKTGFIRLAGYCLATVLRLPENGQQVAVVILGAPSSATRFREARGLVAWVSDQSRALFGDLRERD